MLVQLSKAILAIALTSSLGIHSAWAQAAEKNWKDRAEYDIFMSITQEPDATKKIGLLDTWKEKYAETDFTEERVQLYLAAYQASNQVPKVIESAKELLGINPSNTQALYWITLLTPSLNDTSTAALEAGRTAADSLLANLGQAFAADKKPAAMSAADWQKNRNETEAVARKTLGWIAMQQKRNKVAEQEFRNSLKANPNSAEVSYWLGTVIVAQKVVEKQSEAIYHFVRATSFTGPGELAPAAKKQLEAYLQKVYTNYHGDTSGLDQLRQTARNQVFPPAGFKILSKAEVEVAAQQRLAKENPQLALWLNIKENLTGANGLQYFNSDVKNAAIPKLKGKLVSHEPASDPGKLVLAIESSGAPEVTIQVLDAEGAESTLAGKAAPGIQIEFEGVPIEFTQQPFMLTFQVEKQNLTGWPKQVPAAK